MFASSPFPACLLAAVLACAGAVPAEASSPEDRPAGRPNIVLIVADDLGWADLGCQGGTEIPTPNIDSLAAGGVRFTSGYVSCPVCSPTRAGLLTGRYQQRFGHEFNPGRNVPAGTEFGLPLSQVTLAERLAAAGYVTGMVGKWHLGTTEKYHPLRRGFSEYFGFLGGAHPYLAQARKKPITMLRGTESVEEKEYLTDAFTREAVAFIERHRGETFFLYLSYNAVHTPMHSTKKYLDRFPGIGDEKRRTLAAMLAALDDGVGAVLGKLRERGLEENTLVFFISDNGGPTRANSSRNDPLSGFKGQVLEGGIRVPFLAQWKARLPAGKVYERPVISLDVLPTALAAAGGTLPKGSSIDGVDLLPYLTGEKQGPPHEMLFWRFGRSAAVRSGDWKLVRTAEGPPRLHDLAADIGEKDDLAAAKPDVVKRLESALAEWDSELTKPLWGSQPGGRKKKGDRGAKKKGRKKRAKAAAPGQGGSE